jgi:hypothetical protein
MQLYFGDAWWADEFYGKITDNVIFRDARNYPYNGKRNINNQEKEPILIPAKPNARTVIIEYGDHW